MWRRRFLSVAAWPLAAPEGRAQSTRMRRVAVAVPTAREVPNDGIVAFRQRMNELGWIEGRTIEYVYGYADGDARRYEPVVADLLGHKPDVLFAYFQPMALIAKKLTQEVPIVFTISSNPEAAGLVASLARPGGNVTGASTRAIELDGKRVELLREIRPGIQRIAVLVNPDVPEVAQRFSQAYAKVAQQLKLQILTVEARSAQELGPAFDRMVREGVQGVLGTADPTHLFQLRSQIVGHAARVGIPAMFVDERYVEAGGLASYGTDNVDQQRRGAAYVDKILRDAKPAELPVEEPTKFRMALNLTAAKALRLPIPQSVLLRSDVVIE